MGYGWFIKSSYKDPRNKHAKRPRACRACGGIAIIGDYCDSCRNYLQMQKAKEMKNERGGQVWKM
jgi:hypothetical protein